MDQLIQKEVQTSDLIAGKVDVSKDGYNIELYENEVNIEEMESTSLEIKGRHDACIVPRAVVVVESMMALTLCDLTLRAGLMPRVVK